MSIHRTSTTSHTSRLFLGLPTLMILSAPALFAQTPEKKAEEPTKREQVAQEKAAKQKQLDEKQQKLDEVARKQAQAQNNDKLRDEKEALRQEGLRHKAELAKAARTGQTPYGGDIDEKAKLEIPFGNDSHNFGSVMQGNSLEHSFVFKSTGENPVVIRQAKPTCGCTVGQLMVVNEDGTQSPYTIGDPIEPGREVMVNATIDTTNKRNHAQVKINVYANDPVGLHQLSLSADVSPFMTATPSFLNFGELSEDSQKESVIDIRMAQGEPVALEIDTRRRTPMPNGMNIDLVPVNPDETGRSSHWQVKVKVGPGLVEGNLGYALALVTDKEIAGTKPLPDGTLRRYSTNANISGRVLGVLSCSPQYVSMGLVRPGQVVSRSIQVLSHDPNFELGNPKVSIRGYRGAEFPWADYFKVLSSPVPGRNGVNLELRLEGLPDGSDGSFKGDVVIETGHEKKPELVVTFSGVCRSGVATPVQRSAQKGAPIQNPLKQQGTTKPVEAAKPATGGDSKKAVGTKPVERPTKKSGGSR